MNSDRYRNRYGNAIRLLERKQQSHRRWRLGAGLVVCAGIGVLTLILLGE